MRVIVRRERPHPGAQLRFTDLDGHRFTMFVTNTGPGGKNGQLAEVELRHRRRARCEDRIRNAKDTGLRNLPLLIFSPTILRSSDLRLCVVDSVVHGPSRGSPRAGRDLSALCFPGVSWPVSGSPLPSVLRARARVRRGAGGSLIPGCGCGRWLLPGVAAARRVSPAAGPGPVVMTGPAAAGCGAARSAPAG